MPIVQHITNPDPLVEEKVNYFLDQMTHMSSYAGWQENLELETPISLVDKVLFRLKNDREHHNHYLPNYLKYPFFTSDTFWTGYKTYESVKDFAQRYLQSDNGQRKLVLSEPSFLTNLEILGRELRLKMVRDLMDGVIHLVRCPHALNDLMPPLLTETHALALKSRAQTIVSAYLLKGYTNDEVRDIIGRVFSHDPDRFPFPAEVGSATAKQQYLEARDLLQQLHGFTNAYDQLPRTGKIVVKVFGAKVPGAFSFNYNKVDFYSVMHPFVEQLKTNIPKNQLDDFFTEGDYILAVAENTWFSEHSLTLNLTQTLRPELAYLSVSFNRNLTIDDTRNYLHLSLNDEYRAFAYSPRRFDAEISERVISGLPDNAFQELRGLEGESIDWFLQHEAIFVNARLNQSIADYWMYLEVLLSYNQPEKKEVKEKISTIILESEKKLREIRLSDTINECFMPVFGPFVLSEKSDGALYKVIPAIKDGKIAEKAKAIQYPFVQELIQHFEEKLEITYYQKSKDYYFGILTEAYENRNFLVHAGKEHTVARAKMLVSFPILVKRFRWAVIHVLKQGRKDLPFDLVLQELFEQGEALMGVDRPL